MALLIRSNIYVSFGALVLYLYYALFLGVNFFLTTPLLIFSSTFIAYNALRLIGIKRDYNYEGEQRYWYKKNKLLMIGLTVISLCFIILGIIDLTFKQFQLLMAGFLFVLIYERLFFKHFSLRFLPYLKPFIIAIVWVITCVGLHIESLNSIFQLAVFDCFIFIFFLSLLYDYKDKEEDIKARVKNIIHFQNPKLLYSMMIVVSLVYIYFLFEKLNFPLLYCIPFLIVGPIAVNISKKTLFFNLVVDGLIIYKGLFGIYLLKN